MHIEEEVYRGILFIRLDGKINIDTIEEFNKEIDYLLYSQGISYYTINFNNIRIEENMFLKLQNKLVEIFLSCGKVAMCGLNKMYIEKLGLNKDKLYYVENEREACKILSI